MARLNEIQGKKIALDTVMFIYALEGNVKFGDSTKKIFESIEQEKCCCFASKPGRKSTNHSKDLKA